MIGRGRDLSELRQNLEVHVRSTESQRLDQYLITSLSWKSRTRIQGLIQEGRIRVNGEVTKPSRKVRLGDAITIWLSNGTGAPHDYQKLDLEVLYEDPWLVAVNKPHGLLVHPVGRHVYDTLINYMHHRYRDVLGEDGAPVRPRLCHRLDRDTTGVIVFGKETHTHREVQSQFENRIVSKEYLALVAGVYPRDLETVETPIGPGRSLETCLEHDVLKDSRTSLRVVQRLEACTLLACRPHTGRQNQIRVHLASNGFPLVGDQRYGKGPPPTDFPQRYLLHSRAIRFYHPRLKSWAELAAPLPDDFRNLLERLRGARCILPQVNHHDQPDSEPADAPHRIDSGPRPYDPAGSYSPG
jgi:23S rRNA pseudouridine1911/1915/1917 synthase